ncbi:MAG: GldG family protein, partial [Bdellovibrionales bacterium]|nr:GldG family protein [Bdellovibrionales bacterium]
MNLLSFKYDKIFDLTINGQYSLSPQMLNLLSKNADEIKFKVFYKERKPTRVLKEVEEFFNLVKINFPQVTVSFLNIFDKPDEFQKLMTNQSVNANQEIFCFVSQKQNDEFIEDPCGESEVISGLHKVMKSPEKKIGLITGHGEVDLLIQDGTLLRKLLEGENAKFVPINLFKENDLNQYKLLFLIGPKAPLDRIELQRLEDYSQKGGSLWMALDPGFDLSLDSFLKTYDVEFLNNYVLDETSQFGQSVLLTDRYDNFLKDRLKAIPALLILASEL